MATMPASKQPAAVRTGDDTGKANGPSARPQTISPSAEPVWYLASDAAAELAPGQVRRADYLRILERVVYRSAEHSLAPLGRTSRDCPYLRAMFRFYAQRDAVEVSAALRRYAPETAWAASAAESRRMVGLRVREAVRVWAATGRIERMPEWNDAESSVVAAQVRTGIGDPLPGAVRGRMEPAFGETFTGVRIHTDGPAGELADQQKARALTIGQDVYFARGQYRPGTLVGDAILAHELAHVVQQRSGGAADGRLVDHGSSPEYEQDANVAAQSAVHSIWTRSLHATAEGVRRARVSLRSGLSLQRCGAAAKIPAVEPGGVSPVTHSSSNYTPTGGGQLLIDEDSSPGPVPGMAMEIPPYQNSCDVATSGGSDTMAMDYQAGYVQTTLSSTIEFEYHDASDRPFGFAGNALPEPSRDGVAGTTAPWYNDQGSLLTFPSANSSLHVAMQDTPAKNAVWGNTTRRGTTYHLAASRGRDEFCSWLAVQQVSTQTMTYLNWNTWSVDWAATFDGRTHTGTGTGEGGKLGSQGEGRGQITPVETGLLAKEKMPGLTLKAATP